jgi:hypothetical protein
MECCDARETRLPRIARDRTASTLASTLAATNMISSAY